MEEKQTDPGFSRGQILSGAVVLALVLFAGLMSVQQRVRGEAVSVFAELQAVTEKHTKRILALETKADAPPPVPVIADNAPAQEALRAELTVAQSALSKLTARVEALEKQQADTLARAPKPIAEPSPALLALRMAVESGAPYELPLELWERDHAAQAFSIPNLRTEAVTGLATEAALRTQLQSLIAQAQTPPEAASGIAQTLNQRLAGLVTIKKHQPSVPELAALAVIADIATLAQLDARVAQLPAGLQSAFAPWRATVAARTQALAELEQLQGQERAR